MQKTPTRGWACACSPRRSSPLSPAARAQGAAGGLGERHVDALQRHADLEDGQPVGGPTRAAVRLAAGADWRPVRRARRLRAPARAAQPAHAAGARPRSPHSLCPHMYMLPLDYPCNTMHLQLGMHISLASICACPKTSRLSIRPVSRVAMLQPNLLVVFQSC